jgi:prepilin signal peptidase PulO-like enzyme (type II secretory pathway)
VPGDVGQTYEIQGVIQTNSVLVTLIWAVVGFAGGWLVRWGSVRLAILEELEPGHKRWQVWGPPIVSALVFAAFGYELGLGWLLVARSVFALILVQVIFFDFEHRLILDRVIFPSMGLALAYSILTHPPNQWWYGLATGIAAGLLFALLSLAGALIFKAEALGFGDVKFAAFMGFLLGPLPTIQALFYGVFLAGVVSVAIIIWRRSMKGTIAYGPYLAAGTLIVLFQMR